MDPSTQETKQDFTLVYHIQYNWKTGLGVAFTRILKATVYKTSGHSQNLFIQLKLETKLDILQILYNLPE
jgi:hypothetical protein